MKNRPFRRIGVIGKLGVSDSDHVVAQLCRFLHARGVEAALDRASVAASPEAPTVEREMLGRDCDLAIVIGGDGSFLEAARSLAPFDIPMLGVNLGRLGFLTDIHPEHLEEELEAILAGRYSAEERILLHSEVQHRGRTLPCGEALNDVVIHKRGGAQLIEFEVWIDGAFVNRQRSDGLIIATPTGSTAYALSGGGPILAPTLGALALVPICPHTLSNRPIVVADSCRIEVLIAGAPRRLAQVSCDGRLVQRLYADDRVVVRKGARPIRLIHPATHNAFKALRLKLGWSGHGEMAQETAPTQG